MKFISNLTFPLEIYNQNTKKFEGTDSFISMIKTDPPTNPTFKILIKDETAPLGTYNVSPFGFITTVSTTFSYIRKIENFNLQLNEKFPINSIKYYMYVSFI